MKSFTERDPRIVGVVAIVVALAVVAGVLLLNRSVFVSSYTVHARLANAAGIGKGAPVTLAGVKVGTVRAVRVEGDSVIADLALDHGVVLPHHTAAAVQVQTVLGVLDVALQPRSGWEQPLADGATLTDTSIPVEFQDLQDTAGTVLQQSDIAAFDQLVQELQQATAGKQSEVATIVSGLGKFTAAIGQRQQQVSNLIDAADTLAATVAQRDTQVATVVDDLSTVVQGLAARSGDLTALIVQTDQMATQTSSLIGQNQPQLQGLLDHLQSVLGVVSKHQEDLAQGVSYLSAAIRGFSSIGYSGKSNAPNTWANIYVNVVDEAQGYSVLGNCAALDLALDQILGPDPMPCDERSGPPAGQSAPPSGGPGSDASSPSAAPGADSNGGVGGAGSAGTSSGARGTSGASSTPDPLQVLLGPIAGAS